jgi:hypothetical protein
MMATDNPIARCPPTHPCGSRSSGRVGWAGCIWERCAGYGATFVDQAVDLLEQWPQGSWSPDLADGARVQAVSEAIERAAAEKRRVEVAEVVGG